MNDRTLMGYVLLLLVATGMAAWAEPASAPADGRMREQFIRKYDNDGDGKLNDKEREAAGKAWEQTLRKRAKGELPPNVKVIQDVTYAQVNGKPLKLDMYVPTDAPKPMPVVVFVHGGAWRSGTRRVGHALSLSGRGFAVVSIDYRLTDAATFPAQIHDCKGAIRWVRAHAKEYGFDPDRIGVWGTSAGGHLVALLGTSGGVKELEGDVGGNLEFTSRVQAVADFCGPTSFRLEDLEGLEGVKARKTPKAVEALLGGTVQEKSHEARMASPAEHATQDDPPFLIVHGEKDNVVPVRQARILADALKKAGVEFTLHIDPNAGHGVATPETKKRVEEFFRQHLTGAGAKSTTKPIR